MAKIFTPKVIDGCFDVAVVGGGLAGVMAAVSAAREGSRVVLIEKYGFLGGMATCGLVHPFMPYRENGSGRPANAGLFAELLRRVYETGGSDNPESTMYREEFIKLVLDRMCTEYGIKVLFHSLLSDVEYADGEVKSITISTVSGNIKLKADVYIDATGNGDLFAFAGLPYNEGREEDGLSQPMTMNFRLYNVDWSKLDMATAQKKYKELQAEGKIKNPREDILIFRTPDLQVMHLNTTRIVGADPTDVESYSASEIEVREQVYEMFNFMRKEVAGMENCQLMMSAPELGIRESRRVVGLYEITREDVVSARKFYDGIARATYEIDIHNPAGSGTHHEPVPKNDYYEIPYRALIPVGAKNLIVAGRPISSSHEAHSSLRIMPITTCIGEAAGAAAHMAAKTDTECGLIDVEALRSGLIDHGALV